MKIITKPPLSRWEEYKRLRIEAIENVPQSFLDDAAVAQNIPQEEWERKIEKMYFAEIDGRWVGMVGAYQDEKTKLKHILNIVSVYVSPSFRGQGIGKALLQQVINEAKRNTEIKKLSLGVAISQESALALYESLGFIKSGHLKYAVKVGVEYFDEYLMDLYL
jgi:ribosomal protein S18 acetylase RimI-like enzyme